ncbi:MAG: TerB family tellurite resistance protein [Pseudomonadota bacterium]
MLDKLIALFRDPEADVELTEDDGREAVAAILVAAARADDDYAASERTQIDRILAARYDLAPSEATTLRESGEQAHAEAGDLVRFTRAIKRAVPHEERIAVIEAIWEIAYADGARDAEEAGLVRKLCGLLYVEDREAGLARQRVAQRLGIS